MAAQTCDDSLAPVGLAALPAAPGSLTHRQRFLKACACQPVDRPPVWLMRQAGRVLPEYRALRKKHSFLELVRTPDLAAEVTLQPIRRFDFDAAILFSDILVVAEALGQPYDFREGGGVQMGFPVATAEDIERLEPAAITDRLQYVAQAIPLIKSALGGNTALIGFAGAPWTLANFMMEGGSTREFSRAKALFYGDRVLFDRLCGKLTTATTAYLRMQMDAGADALQIFDSLGGIVSDHAFAEASGRWIKQIVDALGGRVPVIVFARGARGNWEYLAQTGAQVLGVDWTVRLASLKWRLPHQVGIQGNLDPVLLGTTPGVVAAETGRILAEMRGRPGHIFNLGHGVPPTAKLENIESLVYTVRSFV